jgi:hypothetical protein
VRNDISERLLRIDDREKDSRSGQMSRLEIKGSPSHSDLPRDFRYRLHQLVQARSKYRSTFSISLAIYEDTMDSFRKINVDKYDEDTLLEDELIDVDTRSPIELAGLAKQKANDVRGLIGR